MLYSLTIYTETVVRRQNVVNSFIVPSDLLNSSDNDLKINIVYVSVFDVNYT